MISFEKIEYFLGRSPTVLKITGEDAGIFLQGQFTQDLAKLPIGAVRYGLWLDHHGKTVGDSFILAAGRDLFFAVSFSTPRSVLWERLERFVIADDVVVENVGDAWKSVVLWSAQPPEAGQVLPGLGVFEEVRGGFLFRGIRGRGDVWEWLLPVGADLAELRGVAREIDEPEMERRRIEAGVPKIPIDVGPADFPNEGFLEDVAISYSKGCYLGQEVMARLRSMGRIRRNLVRVRAATGNPNDVGAGLFLQDKRVGELRSSVSLDSGFVGLAMVNLLATGGADRLRMNSPDGIEVVAEPLQR